MDDLETKLLREFYSTSSTSTGTKGYTDFLISRIAGQEVENAELKSALQQIASLNIFDHGLPHARDIAYAALRKRAIHDMALAALRGDEG